MATLVRQFVCGSPTVATAAVRRKGTTGRHRHGGQKPKAKLATSPLVDFQRDVREVNHMAPHVLSAAAASAGSSRHQSEALWRAYGERAVALGERLTLRDVRLLLQGYADASIRDHAVFSKLTCDLPLGGENEVLPRDVCSIAIALAKLSFSDEKLFRTIAARVVKHIDEFEVVELGTLLNGFSRVACFDDDLLRCVAARFTASAADPFRAVDAAATTLALNSFAISSYADLTLWESLLDRLVVPRVQDFTMTQCALIANSIARCVDVLPQAPKVLGAMAEHWTRQGKLEDLANSTEDLAYLADAFAQLRISHHSELNSALAAGAMRQLSSFTPKNLAMLCSALQRLPSTGRAALFAMVARHALPDVVGDCSLPELGAIVGAFLSAKTPVPQDVTDLIFARIAEQAPEAASAVLRGQGGEQSVEQRHWRGSRLNSVALANLMDATIAFPSRGQALHALNSMRAAVVALSDSTGLTLRAVTSINASHVNFRVLDYDLIERLARNAVVDLEKRGNVPFSSAKSLLLCASRLDAPQESNMLYLLGDLLKNSVSHQQLDAIAESLLAMALLGFCRFRPCASEALWRRAAELRLAQIGAEEPRQAAQLFVAGNVWRRGRVAGTSEEAIAPESGLDDLEEKLEEGLGSLSIDWVPLADRLDPPPAEGLLRDVFRALRVSSSGKSGSRNNGGIDSSSNSSSSSGGSSSNSSSSSTSSTSIDLEVAQRAGEWCVATTVNVGECVRGFHVDLVVTLVRPERRDERVAIEADGPQRFFRSTRQLLPMCRLKHEAIERAFDRVVHVNYWDWPRSEAEQRTRICELVDPRLDPGVGCGAASLVRENRA